MCDHPTERSLEFPRQGSCANISRYECRCLKRGILKHATLICYQIEKFRQYMTHPVCSSQCEGRCPCETRGVTPKELSWRKMEKWSLEVDGGIHLAFQERGFSARQRFQTRKPSTEYAFPEISGKFRAIRGNGWQHVACAFHWESWRATHR